MSYVDDDDDDLCPPNEEEELSLPRASINKMIKEIVPTIRGEYTFKDSQVTLKVIKFPLVANETRELILNCCTEFIHLISSEANEICNQKNKKTISGKSHEVPLRRSTIHNNCYLQLNTSWRD